MNSKATALLWFLMEKPELQSLRPSKNDTVYNTITVVLQNCSLKAPYRATGNSSWKGLLLSAVPDA